MQFNTLIFGVLFLAIPLMMINFGNRYELLTKLIHSLHDTVINEKILTNDSARFFRQIASLPQRLRLIAIIQTCSALAFIFNLSTMISLYFGIDNLGSWLFLIVFTLQIANDCQRIFFSNIQSLAQIIDFFTFVSSNNAITER